ncbi:MAG: RND transporter [Candidatus Tectimicrobiota bacterium]|nr:MAG: RND transporter [Candidatus Tectomicrobia bacterium]
MRRFRATLAWIFLGWTVCAAQPPGLPPSPPAAPTERVLELSLEDAIRLALQNSLDVERARFGPRIEQTEVIKARAAFDPVLGLDANLSQTKVLPENQVLRFDPTTGAPIGVEIIRPFSKNGEVTPHLRHRFVTGGSYELRFVNTRENVAPASFGTSSRIVDPRYESSLELQFTHPLLRNFGIAVNTAPIRQAEKAVAIAEQQLVQTILDTVFAVQQSYWELVFRIRDLAARRESLRLAQDFLEENRARVELGTLAPIELVQAETQVKVREGDVIVAEAAVRDAEDRLKEVLNLPQATGTWELRLRPTDEPAFAPQPLPSVAETLAEALRQRPDFLQSQLRIDALRIARDVARNQRLPRLDLVALGRLEAFDESFPDSAANLGEAEGYQWLVGVQFEYPLGNRFARQELARRTLELQQAQVEQRRLLLAIERQIRQALRDLETASKRVEVTRAATRLAQTQLEAEQEKFRLGLSTSFNVLEFQEDLTIARSNETRALSDYNIALARLDQLTGRLRYGDLAAAALQP